MCLKIRQFFLNNSSFAVSILLAFARINIDYFVDSKCNAKADTRFCEIACLPDTTAVTLSILGCIWY